MANLGVRNIILNDCTITKVNLDELSTHSLQPESKEHRLIEKDAVRRRICHEDRRNPVFRSRRSEYLHFVANYNREEVE